MLKNISIVFGAIVAGIGAIFFGVAVAMLIAPLVGAFGGLVFSWVFPETANAVLVALDMPVSFWQLGAVAGFFGSFLKTSVSTKN